MPRLLRLLPAFKGLGPQEDHYPIAERLSTLTRWNLGRKPNQAAIKPQHNPIATTLSSLPVELLLAILPLLPYATILSISQVSHFFYELVKTARLPPTLKVNYLIHAQQHFRRYRSHFLICFTCKRIRRRDCFVSLSDDWVNYMTPVDFRGRPYREEAILPPPGGRCCVDCRVKRGDEGNAVGQPVQKGFSDGWCKIRVCPACETAKALNGGEQCLDCDVCLPCLREWKCKFRGFCATCAKWRADAKRYYKKAGYPDYLHLYGRGWYPERRFTMALKGHRSHRYSCL